MWPKFLLKNFRSTLGCTGTAEGVRKMVLEMADDKPNTGEPVI